MRTKKDDFELFIYSSLLILGVLIIIGYIILWFYCMFKYGDKPITEIPSWVWVIINNKQ